MLSANLMPISPKIKYSLYLRAIKKRIIDSNARINVREIPVPLESKENIVAKMNRNISLKERYEILKWISFCSISNFKINLFSENRFPVYPFFELLNFFESRDKTNRN